MVSHKAMTDLLVMALACDQSRVSSMNFNNGASSLTRVGGTITHHRLTHEEVLDDRPGYPPDAIWLVNRIMDGWAGFVAALDAVKEGDGTCSTAPWCLRTAKLNLPSSTRTTIFR